MEGSKWTFEPKRLVRRAAEKSGIPYTFVVNNCFAGWYLTPIGQDETRQTPPRDGKLVILGHGNAKECSISRTISAPSLSKPPKIHGRRIRSCILAQRRTWHP